MDTIFISLRYHMNQLPVVGEDGWRRALAIMNTLREMEKAFSAPKEQSAVDNKEELPHDSD